MKASLRYAAAAICALLHLPLAPVYWLITISLKREIDQFAYPPLWIGFAPTLEHYREALQRGSFATYFLNSVILAAGSTARRAADRRARGVWAGAFRMAGRLGANASAIGFFRRACSRRS